MNETLKNELCEALIRTAVIQNAYEENNSILLEAQSQNIPLPSNYEKKLSIFVRKYARHKKHKSLLFYGKKIASIILIIIGLTFIGLFQFEEIRAACHNIFIEIHNKYIQIDFVPSNSQINFSPKLNHLLDGFDLIQSENNEGEYYWRYENTSGDIIELSVFVQERTVYLDNEHYNVTDIQINNYDGKFFESNDSNFLNYVIWNTNTEYFRLSSSLDKDFMIKLAENVK